MCPLTAGAITAPEIFAGLGIAGAGVTAGGQVLSGMSQGAQAAYQAQVARNNEVIAEQNAKYAIHAGEAQAQAVSLQGAATQGRIKAMQAGSGIDVNTGSAVKVQKGAREAGALNTQQTMATANLQAYGYRQQAMSYAAQAGLEQNVAEEAPIAGDIAGIGSLLSGASAVGQKYGGMIGGNADYVG
jgi:hypothetical protein